MNKKSLLVLGAVTAIVALGGLYRFYDIKNYPPGLFPDEAANGEDIKLILSGDTRPFYPRGNGREALFFYVQSASVLLFGHGVWQLHVASAFVGTLTVAAMYFATRPYFGRTAAVLAALFLATNAWHVSMSRTGFRAIMIPLFVAGFTAAIGYTIGAVKNNKKVRSYIYAVLAGILFAAGFYTYIAYRVMVGVVLGIVFLLLMAALHPKIGFPHVKRYGVHIIIGVLAACLTFAPLGMYFVQYPQDFIGRAGQVSIFNSDLQEKYGEGTLTGTILYSTRETLKSFFTGEGDLNWRHNVAGYPLLNPLVGLLFLLGLAWSIHGAVSVALSIMRGKEVHLGMIYPYLLLLLSGMLLPIITTAEGLPHGLRSVGLVAPIFLLAGTAGAVVVHWIKRKAKTEVTQSIGLGVIVGLLVLGAIYDGALYFVVSRNDKDAAYAYRADLTDVSSYINKYMAKHPETRPYLVLDKFSVQTVHYLTNEVAHDFQDHPDEEKHKYTLIDPGSSHLTGLNTGEIIIFTQSTIPDADRYQQTHGSTVRVIEQRFNRFGQEIMRVYAPAQIQDTTEFNLDA